VNRSSLSGRHRRLHDDAIIGKSLAGIVTSWNKAAESMFGYAAEEICGKSGALLLPADRRREEEQILQRIRRGERVGNRF
jgi:PAS domain S-box-containing protein